MKVSPGGSLPGGEGERAGSKESKGSKLGVRGASWGMLYYVLGSPPPLWGQGVRGSKGSELGARGIKLGARGSKGSELGARGVSWE